MIGHRDKLKSGLEYDVVFKWGRRYLCYLHNNSKLKSYAKNKINRRSRYLAKKTINEEIQDFEELLFCVFSMTLNKSVKTLVTNYQLPITNYNIMITEKELKEIGFEFDSALEDKDSTFDEENNLRVETWRKHKEELAIKITFGARRGGSGECFWVNFEQSIDLYINADYITLKHITNIVDLRLLLFTLKI